MDYLYLLALLVMIFSIIIQFALKLTVKKYSKIEVPNGMTADRAAEIILREADVNGISITSKHGELTDCYSPSEDKIYLSDTTYGKSNVAAIAIAAHECGHAIQKETGYPIYVFRQLLVPVCNFASRFSPYLAIAGFFLANVSPDLSVMVLNIAIIAYMVSFLFYLVLVPVEYNASNRALKIIKNLDLVGSENNRGAKKVLRAAGRTYVIALASSAVTLLRIILIRNRVRGNRR